MIPVKIKKISYYHPNRSYAIILEEIELIEKENNSKDYLQSRIDRYEKMGFFQEQE